MNLILLLITITAVAILLSETSITKQVSGMFSKLFSPRSEEVTDFLAGIDTVPLSFEEINHFRQFLTEEASQES